MKSLRMLLLLLLLPAWVLAAEKPNLTLSIKAEKEVAVTGRDGRTRFVWREISTLNPGETVRYTISYTNGGSSEARNAVIVDPIPPGTAYLADSAEGKGAEITFSLDGKRYEPPTLLTYRAGNGKGTEMTAVPGMYTHIRWKLAKPVPRGGSGEVRFKVTVK
jgi:uncharacterized repeat protein (TIGR01451 family)